MYISGECQYVSMYIYIHTHMHTYTHTYIHNTYAPLDWTTTTHMYNEEGGEHGNDIYNDTANRPKMFKNTKY